VPESSVGKRPRFWKLVTIDSIAFVVWTILGSAGGNARNGMNPSQVLRQVWTTAGYGGPVVVRRRPGVQSRRPRRSARCGSVCARQRLPCGPDSHCGPDQMNGAGLHYGPRPGRLDRFGSRAFRRRRAFGSSGYPRPQKSARRPQHLTGPGEGSTPVRRSRPRIRHLVTSTKPTGDTRKTEKIQDHDAN
jgi:hypothetical protein